MCRHQAVAPIRGVPTSGFVVLGVNASRHMGRTRSMEQLWPVIVDMLGYDDDHDGCILKRRSDPAWPLNHRVDVRVRIQSVSTSTSVLPEATWTIMS